MYGVRPVSNLTSDRSLVKQAPMAPGGRSTSPDAGLATEVAALAGLLAEVVMLAGQGAIFPSRWETVAELAIEHQSVRAALLAEEHA